MNTRTHNLELPSTALSELSKMRDSIHKVQIAVQALPDTIDRLSRYRITDQMEYDSVLRAECQTKLENLNEKQYIWTRQYFGLVEKGTTKMTASNCSSWLSQTQILPEYLSSKTIRQYNEYKQLVEHRLRDCRVQGVVSMFNNLSNEEKAEFLRIIQSTN